jgi:hypothetical protein
MNTTVLIFIGLVAPFFLIVYREFIGDMLGEASWMRPLGGVYTCIVLLAIILFFWALAEATGTTNVLFHPVVDLFPEKLDPGVVRIP